jgi:hypothetical protein
VHCVIVGFGLLDRSDKIIFDYDTPQGEPHSIKAANINPYLVEGGDTFIAKRRTPIGNAPAIAFGSMPNDGGNLLLDTAEKEALITQEPGAAAWIHPLLGSDEFINGIERWCLWLVGIAPEQLRAMPSVLARVEAVRKQRGESTRPTTRALADTPTLFGETRRPTGDYLAIPEVSSERRAFIPIGFLPQNFVATNKLYTMDGASLYSFGIMTSTMHMAWTRAVCGRLESRYQYSAGIVYNNFPWPTPTDNQRMAIEQAAQGVLDARALYPSSTLADLYDPLTMPPELTAAHRKLDRAVDAAYGKTTFPTEAERVAYLFKLYEAVTAQTHC